MNNTKNEFIIGLMVTTATIILVTVIAILGKNAAFKGTTELYASTENAQKLGVGNDVLYKGVRVGSIANIEIRNNQVLLKLKINLQDRIPSNSTFYIDKSNLLGEPAVTIIPGDALQYLEAEDTVRLISVNPLEDMLSVTKEMSSRLKNVLSNVDTLTNEQSRDVLNDIAIHFMKLTDDYSALASKEIKPAIGQIREVVDANKENLGETIQSLKNSSEQMSQVLEKTLTTLNQMNQILMKMNRNQGTFGKLVNDDSLYNNLNRTIEQMDSLLQDIQNNPKKYLTIRIF